ncbi:translocation/assembly module TamB domain-containing protein [Sandaracinobacteroides saxicola]|uniref:Translocation/assembly module TamB domain-containing protein n=1 Tax=Sandaracinobacteroides saxicola TaxID=2759707 RepID=A0A7G5IGY5_9SPHN|nr:translocation/assembly module TamB domain-containing protein [Sandaracinobacteroides saxicola]QMW22627.1 translocation/assembly module TamB domain-containing protein [Sandaracinobacteroides saxicola]
MRRAALILVAILALVAAAIPAGLWWLARTDAGRSFVAQQVAGVSPASGLKFKVGRIDGDLLTRFSLVDVQVYDLDGLLLTAPLVDVAWQPRQLLGNSIAIDDLRVPSARMLRMWRINPSDPDEPLLPDIDIRIDRLTLGALTLEPALAGRRTVLSANGKADIRDGRVLLDLVTSSDRADRLTLRADAEPDRDRFDLAARLTAPAGGLVTTMAGLAKPLALSLDGAGRWSDWRGRAIATLGGARALDLSITQARTLTRVRGNLFPPALLTGQPAALLGPTLAIEADATIADRAIEGRFAATATSLRLSGGGGFDIDANRFRALAVELRADRPAALYPGLSGSALQLRARLDGPRAAPEFTLNATAASLRYKGMGADGLRLSASGTADLSRALTIPVDVGVTRLVGLPANVAALAANPRLLATLRWDKGTLSSQDIRLTTAAARATASGNFTPATGRYAGTLRAQVDRYAVPQLGSIAATLTASVASTGKGPPAIRGALDARALTLANAGVRDFLGGLPTLSIAFAPAADGSIRFSDGRLTAPKLTLANTTGSFNPSTGRFTISTAGRSADYGPLTLVAEGTPAQPRATLTLARPGFGFGITNLVAVIEPVGNQFAITARGQSPQGPLDGRVRILPSPLTLDIDRFALAGLTASGRLAATAAGPFAGTLAINGRGLDADLTLSARGRVQAVAVDARANGARIPLDTPISIANGQANATILLFPGAPHIIGGFNATGIRIGEIALTRASGRANLVGQRGNALLSLAGANTDGTPYSADLGVTALATGYRVGLTGAIGRLPLRLAQPAEIDRVPGGFALRPARLLLPKGQVDVQGEWAARRSLRARLSGVDLSIATLADPELRLGGALSGDIDLALAPGADLPTGRVRLNVVRLTRAGLTTVSAPIDVAFAADATASGIVAGATLANGNTPLGRARVTLDPGPGEDAVARLMSGTLAGGIRYNGPAEALWALSAIEGQELEGALALGADVSGPVRQPAITGIARGRNLTYSNNATGTVISNLQLDSRFTGSRFELLSLTGTAGKGSLSAKGGASLDNGSLSVDIGATLDNARLANSELIAATLSGPLRLSGSAGRYALTGDLRLLEARTKLVRSNSAAIPVIAVRRKGEVRVPDADSLSPGRIALDVAVKADNNIFVEGMGLESEWRTDMRLRGTPAAPELLGTAQVVRGTFEFAGREFTLKRGRIGFNGAPLDSSLDIQAETIADTITATVAIAGSAKAPSVNFSSVPTLPQDEVLARLLFGTSVADLSLTEAVQLATAVASLQGGGGLDPVGKLRRAAGIDRLKLLGEDKASGRGPSLAVGKRLSRNVYVEVTTDSEGNAATQVQLSLSRVLSLLAQVGSFNRNSVNLRYSRDY